MDKNKEALEAFERIFKDAFYGIDSGDHEIMNPENYEKEMSRCCDDRQTVLSALQTQAELVETGKELREIIEGIKGALEHGTWRNDFNRRLKDTPEWVKFYLALQRAEGEK